MPADTIVERADLAVAEAAAPAGHHALTRMAGMIGEVADQPQMITLCSTILSVGLLRSDRRLAATGLRMLAAELLATAMKSAVKHRIVRTRPHVVNDGGRYEMEKGEDRSSERSSFPSGHTAGAVAVALVAGRDYPGIKGPALAGAAAIAAIQIPRCKHFVSDVVAGTLVGAVAAGGVLLGERLVLAASKRFGSDRPRRERSAGSAGEEAGVER